MVTDTPVRCKREYNLDEKLKRCPRSASESGYCALHDPELAKDSGQAKAAIEETLNSGANPLDFSNGIFYDTESFGHRTFKKRLIFDDSIFHQDVHFYESAFIAGCSFKNTTFHQKVNFSHATFNVESSFVNATFLEKAHFADAILQGTSFIKTKFKKGVDFSNATLSLPDFSETSFGVGEAVSFQSTSFDRPCVFHKTIFKGRTSFHNCSFNRDNALFTFRNCDMSGLLLTECPFFPHHIKLLDCIWPKRYGKRGRLIVRDEFSEASSSDVVRAYHNLHKIYYNRSEFDNNADEFYVSFMVAKRKATKGNWAGKFASLIYSILSRYGQSISRPLVYLLVMWAVFPAILLWLGIQLGPDGDVVHLGTWDEYFKAVQLNFSLSTLVRSSELRPPITSIQNTILLIETFLNALLGSFIGLGIRRRFAPKKPL